MASSIVVEAACYTSEELEKAVDEDIDEFEVFFKGLGNDGLAPPERAIIKTYLWFKTHPEDTRGKETGS